MITPNLSRSDISVIERVLSQWLADETVNADTGRNGHLSRYDEGRDDLFKQFDVADNDQPIKTISHYDRFRVWVNACNDDNLWLNDLMAAKIMFGCMMSISGAYRKQCFIESEGELDYIQRRNSRPIGVALRPTIESALNELSRDSYEYPYIEIKDMLAARSLQVNDESLKFHKSTHRWVFSNPKAEGSLATVDDYPIEAMKAVQQLWLGLVSTHIVVATSLRGGNVAKVPFLEPKSITDAQKEVIYPFTNV